MQQGGGLYRFSNNLVGSCYALCEQFIADSLKSFESGFTAFRSGNKKLSTEKENFDLKESRKLKAVSPINRAGKN